MTPAEVVKPEDNVKIVLRGPDGEIKSEQTVHNLIVDDGEEGILDQLLGSPSIGKPTHMAIGTSSTAASAGQTALSGTELKRVAFDSKERSGSTVTMIATFGPGEGTGEVKEAGIFNSGSEPGGTMYARAVLSVVNKGAEDTLEITWTFTGEGT